MWRQIIGLRHTLEHEYFGVDAVIVWQIIESDMPNLKIAVAELLTEL